MSFFLVIDWWIEINSSVSGEYEEVKGKNKLLPWIEECSSSSSSSSTWLKMTIGAKSVKVESSPISWEKWWVWHCKENPCWEITWKGEPQGRGWCRARLASSNLFVSWFQQYSEMQNFYFSGRWTLASFPLAFSHVPTTHTLFSSLIPSKMCMQWSFGY